MENAQDYKPTQRDLEDFGKYVMTEIANQAGGLDNVEEIHPRDLIPSNGVTIELVQELAKEYDKVCLVGVNIQNG